MSTVARVLYYGNAMLKPSVPPTALRALQKALQVILLALLLVTITFASAVAQPRSSQVAPEQKSAQPIRTINDAQQPQKVNQDRQREQAQPHRAAEKPAISKPRGDRPSDPYQDYYDAMRKFNKEVYGEHG